MKKIVKILFTCFLFILTLTLFSGEEVSAKTSVSEKFEVTVGDTSLPVYYTLEEIDGTIKERVQFNVILNGKSSTSNSYRWEHTLCYKIGSNEEVCEIDLTGADQGDTSQTISSNQQYNFYFYDSDMPYYSEDLLFEQVRFNNKLVCLDCGSSEEIIFEEIYFSSNEIDYRYKYDTTVSYTVIDGKNYLDNIPNTNPSDPKIYVRAALLNNSYSALVLDGAPTYNIINQICVGENLCDEVIGMNNTLDTITFTPYNGSFYFFFQNIYNGVYTDANGEEKTYDTATIKVSLECKKNCDSRRVQSPIVLHEDVYYMDSLAPSVVEESMSGVYVNEVEYIKNSDITILLEDKQSGLDESTTKYAMVRPYSVYCNLGSTSEYSFTNGSSFNIGSDLSDGGWCMYYKASDKMGNEYRSEYFIFYFDNNGPVMTFNNSYDSSKYYNNVVVSPTFIDNYSGVKEAYYLWSKSLISDDNYLDIKNNGKLYNGEISSRDDISEDGEYYLYFLAYDNLDNYVKYDLGNFNIDTIGLSISDINVSVTNMGENYSNTGTINISVSEMDSNEEILCGFFKVQEIVKEEDLVNTCFNNQTSNIPPSIEGEYALWVRVHDRANNYSLLKISDNLKVDTKGPSISSTILYDDDLYRIVNRVTLVVNDLSAINSDTLKYGWFSVNKNNVTSSDLVNSFVNSESISYPLNYYGEYKLYVRAIDVLGNETFMSFDKVFKVDTESIRISLVGENSITIIRGQDYEEMGARAYKGDVSSGGRVSEIRVEGSVNNKKEGTYYVTYSSGEGDLLVSVTRKVIVKNDLGYIIASSSLFIIGALFISLRLFIRRKSS